MKLHCLCVFVRGVVVTCCYYPSALKVMEEAGAIPVLVPFLAKEGAQVVPVGGVVSGVFTGVFTGVVPLSSCVHVPGHCQHFALQPNTSCAVPCRAVPCRALPSQHLVCKCPAT